MRTFNSILVTGGAGFIGSHVVRKLLTNRPDAKVVNLDALTYAGNLENLRDVESNPHYAFVKGDIQDTVLIERLFAEHAFDNRWVDYQPRAGKRPGGFCSSSSVLGQSRIFMTYHGAAGDVQTLAHELGHAFHSWLMRDMRHWQRRYPMTLAETASTFAEKLVTDAALEAPGLSSRDRAAMLDQRLQDAEAFLLDIPMRFDFEHELYTRRASGELTVSDLQEMMLSAQRSNFGDALDEDQLDPWFWASKLHFYITGISFYNFPYTFGYLFSMGLFARAKDEGRGFLPRYEALLRETGSAPAETVAWDALGVDLEDEGFWHSSIDMVEGDLEDLLAMGEPVDDTPLG